MCFGNCQASRVEEHEKTFSAPTLHSWLVEILTCVAFARSQNDRYKWIDSMSLRASLTEGELRLIPPQKHARA